ncbi:MAG: glycosyltransferase family 2 protein [Solirubrobacteraceae bacterium]
MGNPALSVIIATRDRPEDLSRCLEALALQTLNDELDVVVVDDGSIGDLQTIVHDYATSGLSVRYVRQEGTGAAKARDHGTSTATADLLAYLDDDAVPEPEWAEAIVSAFRDWGCDALAGRIRLRLLGPAPDWLHGRDWRALGELDLGPWPLWLYGREVPYSGNCAVTRSYFELVGGFSAAATSRVGHTLSVGEDIWFFEQVKHLGGSTAYAPEVCIEHVVNPRRLTEDWFIQRAIAQGAGTALLRLGRDISHARQVMLLLREVSRLLLRLPAELARDTFFRRGTIGTRLFLAYERGALFALLRRHAPSARESL